MALKQLEKFDHPIIFAISITLVVVGMIAVLSWVFMTLGWMGPLSVLKGGIVNTSPNAAKGPAPQ